MKRSSSLAPVALALFMAAGAADAAVGPSQPGMMRPDYYDNGMHVIVTGSGSALPDPERGNASIAVVIDGKVLQFDLGRMALENLLRAGVKPTSIDYLFFTHHHFDHVASYGYFLISNWIGGRQGDVQVFGPKGTEAMTRGAYELHASDLVFGRNVWKNWPLDVPGRPSERPPYVVKDIDAGVVMTGPNFTVRAMRTDHYSWGEDSYSLAYRVDSPYGSVVITGDTGPMLQQMSEFARDVDMLIHEVQRPELGMVPGGKMQRPDYTKSVDGQPRRGVGHTSPTQAGEIAAAAKAKMLVAYHLPPFTSDAAAIDLSSPFTGNAPGFQIWGDYVAAMKSKYDGKVVIAADAMVFEIKPAK
jgi:ribonuclease Z